MNHKKVQRVYRAAGLCVRRIRRKRLTRSYVAPAALTAPNQEWAIDFASDVTASGRRLRVFSVVDAFTRECLALETDTSMPSRRVTRVLGRIVEQRGAPKFLRSDNGPEVSSRQYLAWCVERNIATIHIQPGKPTQNGHVESFHGRLRDECLNASWFWNLWDARRKISSWRVSSRIICEYGLLAQESVRTEQRYLRMDAGTATVLQRFATTWKDRSAAYLKLWSWL